MRDSDWASNDSAGNGSRQETSWSQKGTRIHPGENVGLGKDYTLFVDCAVAENGTAAGARISLPRFVKSYETRGLENIPPYGPLVIASNHPASIDSIVITACIDRPDLKAIIDDIPFLEHLPHLSQHAIYLPRDGSLTGRLQVLRESLRHLNGGGSLLIFPRGTIEADPEFMPDADAEFNCWSRSLEIFMQRVPNLQTLVTIASGVISPAAMRNPITWLRKARRDKQRLVHPHIGFFDGATE